VGEKLRLISISDLGNGSPCQKLVSGHHFHDSIVLSVAINLKSLRSNIISALAF